MASDSCFSGGERFHAAPKIFTMTRQDIAFSCAGSTEFSFPIAEHLQRCVSLSQKVYERAIDITDLIHYLVDIINKSLCEIYIDPNIKPYNIENGPDFSILMAGFSWKENDFVIYKICFDKKQSTMQAVRIKKLKNGCYYGLIGDTDAVNEMNNHIQKFLNLQADGAKQLDLMPLKYLLECIKNPKFESVGGYPQMIKMFPFQRITPIGFIHGKTEDIPIISFFGRPLLNYETIPFPLYNLDTDEINYMKVIQNGFTRKPERIDFIPAYKVKQK